MAYDRIRRREILSTLLLVLIDSFLQCTALPKPIGSATESDRWKVKDTQPAGSNLWAPEYYDGNLGNRKDFVTSSYEDKYSNNSPSYSNKNRLGFTPFNSGSVYSPGGLYERRPTYGTAYPIDYGTHDYETPYEHAQHAPGYGLNYPPGGKDMSRSVLIPLAGAVLLGIAAALVTNPVLLHLGVTAGKRKRRSVASAKAHSLAYHAQLPTNVD